MDKLIEEAPGRWFLDLAKREALTRIESRLRDRFSGQGKDPEALEKAAAGLLKHYREVCASVAGNAMEKAILLLLLAEHSGVARRDAVETFLGPFRLAIETTLARLAGAGLLTEKSETEFMEPPTLRHRIPDLGGYILPIKPAGLEQEAA